MDTKTNIHTPQKTSFFHKIIAFTRNDADYQPEMQKPVVHSISKNRSWAKNIKAAIFVLLTFYFLLCTFILLNPQFALFFNNVFAIEYVTIQRVLEYTIFIFYSLLGIVF